MATNDNTFFAARGCYYLIRGGGSPSFYNLSPALGAGCPILYNYVELRGQDFSAKTICFNGIRNTATISKGYGQASVGGIALLGMAGNSCNFGAVFRGYVDQARVFKKVGECMVSSASAGAWKFLLETYTLGQIDPQYNIQQFSVGGALMD
jgi:hypothetical protein